MTERVRIEPSGRTFNVMPDETLLEAALRSGINIRYSCNNGTCGECKVRLLEGEVSATMQAGYRFTTQEVNEGFILPCISRAESELVIEAQEANSPAAIPLQSLKAKVAKVEQPSEHVRILHLRTPRTKTLRFMAGQHVCLALPGVGSFDAAVASCPCNGMNLQFHLPERPADPFLSEPLHVGQKLDIRGPYGDTTLDVTSERALIMLAMGTEIAPIKSVLEQAVNLDLRQPVRLIWLASESEGHYLDNHCRAWCEVLDDYRFSALSMAGSEPDEEALGALCQAITEQLEGLDEADAYLAGSRLFRQAAQEQLLAQGLDPSRIYEFKQRVAPRENIGHKKTDTA
ncbi:MAG: 2Fe-2S iron-sulfur cluster-binding protein [Pseudomonadota bacterium]